MDYATLPTYHSQMDPPTAANRSSLDALRTLQTSPVDFSAIDPATAGTAYDLTPLTPIYAATGNSQILTAGLGNLQWLSLDGVNSAAPSALAPLPGMNGAGVAGPGQYGPQ